jgi:hypothetical protein
VRGHGEGEGTEEGSRCGQAYRRSAALPFSSGDAAVLNLLSLAAMARV